MISGTTVRVAAIALSLAATPLRAADADLDTLLGQLVRPAPDSTSFVEVRYSSLLDEPIVVSGVLEHRTDGALVRRVESPYQEITELQGENVTVTRAGSQPRRFSLDRAPELRGMLASFGALLTGDRKMLEKYFKVELEELETRWEITLVPRDRKLQRRLARIVVDGTADRPRCFTMLESDGDGSVMALGVAAPADLPAPLDRPALEAWCTTPPRD
jgi:hypothetical protein